MSTISLPGQTKVRTLQERFFKEFGLTLRVYDGRSFAEREATIGEIRKKKGATSIDIRKNTKIGNLEDRFMSDFGIKVQIAGSDNSYLCDNEMTLSAALKEDARKLERKTIKEAKLNRPDLETKIEFTTVQENASQKVTIFDLNIPQELVDYCTKYSLKPDVNSGLLVCDKDLVVACSELIDKGLACEIEDIDDVLAEPDDEWNQDLINEMHEIILSILIGDGETYVSSIEDAKNDGEWIINYGEIEKKGCNIIYRKFCLEPQGFEMKELIMAD